MLKEVFGTIGEWIGGETGREIGEAIGEVIDDQDDGPLVIKR